MLFFTPVVLVYIIVEFLLLSIPTNFSIIGDYLDKNKDTIEVAVFGSSQVKNAVNPEFIDKPTINFSSTMQHHNIDFQLLKQTRKRLKNLQTVVFEISFSHFEIGHNSKYYWKSNVFLKYYDVNILNRIPYPSDRLLFVSHPGYFSKLLLSNYIQPKEAIVYNKYGFNKNRYLGKFKTLQYDTLKINNSFIKKIKNRANKKIFDHNVTFFYKMLDYCKEEGLNIIIMSPPTYTNYNKIRNPIILKRRDSILKVLANKYQNIYFLNSENDPDFTATMFWNENHLNSDGAEIFSKKLSEIINKID